MTFFSKNKFIVFHTQYSINYLALSNVFLRNIGTFIYLSACSRFFSSLSLF